MNNFVFKQFYYCHAHDDVFFMITPSGKKVGSSIIERQCCFSDDRTCQLNHIGKRTYVDGKMIKDTTPPEEWFKREGGGYLKEFLENNFDQSRLDCL